MAGRLWLTAFVGGGGGGWWQLDGIPAKAVTDSNCPMGHRQPTVIGCRPTGAGVLSHT